MKSVLDADSEVFSQRFGSLPLGELKARLDALLYVGADDCRECTRAFLTVLRELIDQGGRRLCCSRWAGRHAVAHVEDVFPVLAGEVLVRGLDCAP